VPHYSTTPRFRRDLRSLPKAVRAKFAKAVREGSIPAATRVHATSGVYEMTFAPNGRATWQYGPTIEPGVPHVVWRRVGTHDVLGDS
jgi:hypothetical protein